jgi:hypothetical protein
MHMPAHWIAVGAIVLLGCGILTGVKKHPAERFGELIGD